MTSHSNIEQSPSNTHFVKCLAIQAQLAEYLDPASLSEESKGTAVRFWNRFGAPGLICDMNHPATESQI
jgi:hypothetical protein